MSGDINVISLTVSNTIAVTANGIWIMFMPYYFSSIFGSTEAVGLFFSFSALATAGAYPLGGHLADRTGRCPLILIGRLVSTIGPLTILFVFLLVSSPVLEMVGAILGYILVSLGAGLRMPASSMLVMESSKPQKKSRNYMIAERVLPSIPPALSVLLGAQLYTSGQMATTLFLGFLGLAISAIPLLFLRETLVSSPELCTHDTSPLKIPLTGIMTMIALAFVLDGVSSQGLSWYVPLFLGEENALLYGLMISLSTVVIAFFSLLSGMFVDRVGIRASLVPGWIFLSLTVVLFSMSVTPLLSVILYCIWVALDTVDTAIPPLIISASYPSHERATRMGMFSMVVRTSLFLGPLLVSFLLLFGSQLPFFAKALMNMVAAVIILFITRQKTNNNEPVVTFK